MTAKSGVFLICSLTRTKFTMNTETKILIESLNLKQLVKFKKFLDRIIHEKKQIEKQKLHLEFSKLARNAGLSIEDIFIKKPVGNKESKRKNKSKKDEKEIIQTKTNQPIISLEDQIISASLSIANGKRKIRVRLSDLRDKLPEIPKHILDEKLLEMQRGKNRKLTLFSLDDPYEIKKRDREAVINIAGFKSHILYLE